MNDSDWGTQLSYGDCEVAHGPDGRPRLLGQGNFGKTLEGLRRESIAGAVFEEAVAIKVLNPALLRSESKREQFIQEVAALKKLKHSNLIHYLRCGEQAGEVYFVMELCRGGDLLALAKRFGPLPEQVVRCIGLQVASGLREVHLRLQLVHRDIKPSNIMLIDALEPELTIDDLAERFEQQESLCRIVDFGLVNSVFEGPAGQGFAGSPMFASPEQIREQAVDGRSDIYSLGLTLWHLAQGKGPMLDEAGAELRDPRAAISRHLEPSEHSAHFPAGLSADFHQLLSKMTAKNPAQRFANAAEAQAALRSWSPKAAAPRLRRQTSPNAAPFPLTRLTSPVESRFAIVEKVKERWDGIFAAREKPAGELVRLTMIAEVKSQASTAETDLTAGQLCQLAKLTHDPTRPKAILSVRSVVWASDFLICVEEMPSRMNLSGLLEARGGARRPMGIAEALPILSSIAEALDFLVRAGHNALRLSIDDIWLSVLPDPHVLTTPLRTWRDFGVRFSAVRATLAPQNPMDAASSLAGATLHGSVGLSGSALRPATVFARLVYRILNGSEMATAVQLSPDAYVPTVTLGHASNNLLRGLASSHLERSDVISVVRELCKNEGVVQERPLGSTEIFSPDSSRPQPSKPSSEPQPAPSRAPGTLKQTARRAVEALQRKIGSCARRLRRADLFSPRQAVQMDRKKSVRRPSGAQSPPPTSRPKIPVPAASQHARKPSLRLLRQPKKFWVWTSAGGVGSLFVLWLLFAKFEVSFVSTRSKSNAKNSAPEIASHEAHDSGKFLRDLMSAKTPPAASTSSYGASSSKAHDATKLFHEPMVSTIEVFAIGTEAEKLGAARALVQITMLDFQNAVRNRSFEAFHANVSKQWQQQVTRQDIEKAFSSFLSAKTAFPDIGKQEPTFDTLPQVQSNGSLKAKGVYLTQPYNVRFSLTYVNENLNWKLYGIDVSLLSPKSAL